MKIKLILLVLINFLSFSSYADIKKNISNQISETVLGLIPGDGHTEFTIDIRENYKPDFSILAVRELEKTTKGNIFTQLSLFSTEQNNKERYVGNLGLGSRWLSDDKTILSGLNIFLDYDHEGNTRGSVGAELKNAVMALTSNYYQGMGNGAEGEKVMDGYNLKVSSQIPHLHWADIFYNDYKYKGKSRDDIEGVKIGADITLSPKISLEAAYDDKEKNGLEDEWYARILFVHPPKEGPTALDGISSKMWKEERDMSDELLSKVDRQNKIMVEFSGLTTVSRGD